MRYEPPAGSPPAHTRTQLPFHFCPGVYYARLVEELRPLTYGLVGHKTKLMPKDQWSTILGHSPDVADALDPEHAAGCMRGNCGVGTLCHSARLGAGEFF